jgi:hypothetical protein
MSWADDEGISSYDEDMNDYTQECWKFGFHRGKDKMYRISEMTNDHLINTIKLFENNSDVECLELEAEFRGLKTND